MTDFARYYLFVFGLLTILGGVMGFVKAQSRASLIAGGISGVLLLIAGWLMGEHRTGGLIMGLVLSVLLAGRFVPGYLKTKKFMPAGLMSILSVIGIVVLVAALVTSA